MRSHRTSVRGLWSGDRLRSVADSIVIRGAKEHNLKNVSLELPRDRLIVFTGLSGSGKSSLAFDTIYAEGQRRYVESLSAVRPPVPRPDGQARRRLHRGPVAGHLDRPEVGVAQPAVDGRHDHRDLRLPPPALRPHRRRRTAPRRARSSSARRPSRSSTACSSCPRAPGSRCSRRSSAAARAPTRRCSTDLAAQGFARARVDGEVHELTDKIDLARYEKHTIEVVVDRLVKREGIERRLTDSLETALRLAEGVAEVEIVPRDDDGGVDGEPEIAHLQPAPARPPDGRQLRGARAPQLLVQLAVRRLRRSATGSARRYEVDPELVVPEPRPLARRGRDRAVGRRAQPSTSTGWSSRWARHTASTSTSPWSSSPRSSRRSCSTASAKERVRSSSATATAAPAATPRSTRASIPYLQRRHAEAESDCGARADRGLHARGAVPRVRRRPPEAVVARGHDRRPQHRRPVRPVDRRSGQGARGARACPSATA